MARSDVETTGLLEQCSRLQCERHERDASGLQFIEGVRNFVQAVTGGSRVRAIIYSERLLQVRIARRVIKAQRDAGTPTFEITPEAFRSISVTARASGVGAIIEQRWHKLHRVSPKSGLCWVALEMVRSPGNLGTLIRTAEAVGAAGFIFVGPRVDPFHPAVVRATMGALFRQTLIRTTDRDLAHWVRRHRCQVVGASPDGARAFHRFRYRKPTILMLGEERAGLSETQRDQCTDLVRIPMVGRADSLNVAIAGSLMLYEVFRSKVALT